LGDLALQIRNTASSGRKPRTDDAIVSATWMADPPIKLANPTVIVSDFVWVSTRSGHRKAFQGQCCVG
jgi:hypothetical protein